MCYLLCVLPRSRCLGTSPPPLRMPPFNIDSGEQTNESQLPTFARTTGVVHTWQGVQPGYSLWREYICRKSVYDSAVIVLLGSPEQMCFHEDAVQGPRNIVKTGAYFGSDLFRKKLELRPFFRLSYLARDWQLTVQDHQNLEKVNLGLPKFS